MTLLSFRFNIRHVEYHELETLYRYVQRSTIPNYLGRSYGVIYEKLLGMPDLEQQMNHELDEASEYLASRLSEVRTLFQKEFFRYLKKQPPSYRDIYLMNYYTSSTEIYTKLQIDVDYHDNKQEIIEINDENILDYFDFRRQFVQDKTNSYSDAEAIEYSVLDDDYYFSISPFEGVEKYDDLGMDTMSCRNFTFQVTEDCNLRCFVMGTPVIMADYSQKNIEDIRVGDEILGFNKKNHTKMKKAKVTHVFEVRKARVVGLKHPEIGEVLVTPDHEFITSDNRWIRAIDIKPEDEIVFTEIIQEEKSYRPDTVYLKHVEVNKKRLFEDERPVYNIETETGTYIAGNLSASNCSYCFPAGTKIMLADRTVKNIEAVQIGDKILGFDENVKDVYRINLYPAEVTNLFLRRVEVYRVDLGTGVSIRGTYEHPMLTTRGWVPIGELKPGDRLVRFMGVYDNQLIFSYPEVIKITEQDEERVYNITTSCHTFIADQLLTHNCYQTNKNASIMDIETAKSAVDDLLAGNFSYLSPGFSKSIILEFIGGDPLLEIELIEEIYQYFLQEAYRLNHPWFHHHRISMCSNGLLYFNEETQKFFDRYAKQISFNVSIDGNKALHDSCRIQPTGEGSYDIGIAAVHHSNKKYMIDISSKMTLAPSNIPMIVESAKNLCIDNNYPGINLNVVFENVWSVHDAQVLYGQMKGITDMVINHDRPDLFFSIFRSSPLLTEYDISEDINNVCFAAGTQVLTVDGHKNIEDLVVGDKVFSASGTEMTVVKTTHRFSENNVHLEADGLIPTDCTADHPVIAMKKGKKGFYPVGELQVGDMIGFSVRNFAASNESLPEEIAYLIGMFCADGAIVTGKAPHADYVLFTPERGMVDYYHRKIVEAGLVYSDQSVKRSIHKQYFFRANDSHMNYAFVHICKQFGLSKEKIIPGILLLCDNTTVCAFLRGYIENNDRIYKVKDTIHQCLRMKSVHMVNDLMYILRSLGYFPTVRCINATENGQQYHQFEVCFNMEESNQDIFHPDDEFPIVWSKITDIHKTDSFEVYNATVEGPATPTNLTGEHTMIYNGLAAKQCGGGNGSMLALDPHGVYYPCIRYMPSSLNNEAKELVIGDVENKMDMESFILREVAMMTYITQQNDKCLSCPLVRMCTWCFKAGTLVLTDKGQKNIEEIQIGDMVVSHDGSLNPVSNVMKHYSEENIIIRPIGAPHIHTTKSHKFLVRRVRHSGARVWYEEPKEIPAGEIKARDKVALHKSTHLIDPMDPNLAYVVGLWLGDGWVSVPKSGSNRYGVCCDPKKEAWLEASLTKAGLIYRKVNAQYPATQYYLSSIAPENQQIISILSTCGRYSHGKDIPPAAYTWNPDAILALLQGLYDTDGTEDERRIRFSTTSKKLAISVGILERSVGIFSGLSVITKPENGGTIDGRVIKCNYTPYERSHLKSRDELAKSYMIDDPQFTWTTVREPQEDTPDYVYNITVENTHAYVAEGVEVLNCSALCYQNNGTINERTTHICDMIKAEYLGSIYYWGNMVKHYPDLEINLDEKLVDYYIFQDIISREEYDMLAALLQK